MVQELGLRLQKFNSCSGRGGGGGSIRMRTFVGNEGSTSVIYHEVSARTLPPELYLRSGFLVGRRGTGSDRRGR